MSHVTVLTAGSGGARLVAGLIDVRSEEEVHVLANVGSDCEIWGLYCCPDIDIVLHTVGGERDPFREANGVGDHFECFDMTRKLGMPAWLPIPDRDLATHLLRTELLRSGATLETATARLGERFGMGARLMPLTNDPIRTTIHTAEGSVGVLEYRARYAALSRPTGVAYEGAATAKPCEQAVESILGAERVVIAPSDPRFGIGALLSLPDIRNALVRTRAGVVAICPMIGSQPARGEIAIPEQAESQSVSGAVRFAEGLRGIVDSLVIHTTDLPVLDTVRATGVDAWADNILMDSRKAAGRLAARVTFADRLVARKR